MELVPMEKTVVYQKNKTPGGMEISRDQPGRFSETNGASVDITDQDNGGKSPGTKIESEIIYGKLFRPCS